MARAPADRSDREGLERLRRIYAATDEALGGWSCEASTDCCHFERTGREPQLWPVEWRLVARELAAAPPPRAPAARRGALSVLPDEGRCPLLDPAGRCRVYAARPFGCRTFFCDRAVGPGRRPPRAAIVALGRDVAALGESLDPRAGGPRPLRSWIAGRPTPR